MIIAFVLVGNNIVTVSANSFSNNLSMKLENYVFNYEYQEINDNLEVYGNVLELTMKDFIEITEEGTDKIYMHYRTSYNIDLPYDLFVVIKRQGKYYHYDYKVSSNNNTFYLLNGIKSYLRINNDAILNDFNSNINLKSNNISSYSNVPNTFIDSVATGNFTIDFPKKGYIVYRIAVSEYRANSTSSIFIIKVISSFVPGIVARENGNTSYDKWRNDNGYVHITVEQAYDKNEAHYYGTRYGTIPYFKDFWPNNQPTTVTISSSLNTGLVLGYSKKDGFGIDGSISYGYSKSITYTNPHVNAQMSPNLLTAQWSYKYDKNRPWTHDQESNYMYEISSSGGNMLYGDVRLKLDYKFVVDRAGFYSQQPNEESLDLMVRIQNSRIYDFCNGMI